MIKFFIPIIFLAVSVLLFFGYIDPKFSDIKKTQQEEQLYRGALDNSKELQSIRDGLLTKYNSFGTEDLDRLKKILPNNINSVRLIRDIDGIASRYGMTLRNVSVNLGTEKTNTVGPSGSEVGTMVLGFSVSGPYKIFISFLEDVEKSMRIMDITEVAFTSSENDLYEYKISLKTYWLK